MLCIVVTVVAASSILSLLQHSKATYFQGSIAVDVQDSASKDGFI